MLFSLLIFDVPDSASLRDEWRQRHLDYVKALDAETLFAGPFTTDDESADLGSLRLVDFEDRAAAERNVAEEPYVIGGVQTRWKIHRWRASTPHSWRDCPRREGNIQAMFHGLDGPKGPEIRAALRDAHAAYWEAHGQSVLVRGPLLADDGESAIGSVILMDVPDLAAARALMADEPFHKAGCYEDVIFHRWRFGRVFDRFKV